MLKRGAKESTGKTGKPWGFVGPAGAFPCALPEVSIRFRAEDWEDPRRQPPARMKFDVVGPVSIRSRAEDREKPGSDAQGLTSPQAVADQAQTAQAREHQGRGLGDGGEGHGGAVIRPVV